MLCARDEGKKPNYYVLSTVSQASIYSLKRLSIVMPKEVETQKQGGTHENIYI